MISPSASQAAPPKKPPANRQDKPLCPNYQHDIGVLFCPKNLPFNILTWFTERAEKSTYEIKKGASEVEKGISKVENTNSKHNRPIALC